MINESQVSFYPGGGHSHDGENSSLINTSIYSVYDFPVQIVGDPERTADQTRNLDSFKQLIIDTVNQSIIAPSGIVFQQGIVNGSAHIISRSISTETIAADAITANEIAAGTITADLLAANFVLVNNIISSNNYVPGVSGWAINSDGSAEFDIAVIRGQIVADSISINVSNYWNSDGTFSVGTANSYMFYNGINLELSGTVTATAGQIAGWVIDGDNLTTGGNFSGDMELGKFAGSNFAGMRVAGQANVGGFYPEITITQGVMDITVTNGSTATSSSAYTSQGAAISDGSDTTTYTGQGVIYNNYSQQNWEFVKSGNDLFAIVDGTPYCLQQCGSSPTTTTTTSGGGGGGGGGATTTTTTAAPSAYRLCTPGDLGFLGCNNPGECREGASGGSCDPNATTTTTAAATTTTTVAPTTTTTVAPTTTTTAAPTPNCVCCVGVSVQETRCIRGSLEFRNGVSYNGTCGASGSSGTGCSGECAGCSCPALTEWGSWTMTGTPC